MSVPNRFWRFLLLVLFILGTAGLTSLLLKSQAKGEGNHAGEADKIQARVEFLDPKGQTTTDAGGIHYNVNGFVFSEPKVYPSWTYGVSYPLYFIGYTMNFKVHLTNLTSQGNKRFKVRVRALNHALETDGSLGVEIVPSQEWVVESLAPGETRTVSGSVSIPDRPDIPSGLDVTKIRISHLNEGSNEDAGLIKEELALWCPPKP